MSNIDTRNPEFQTALQLVQYTRQSVFLTGKAGTGKSTFLKYVCAHTKKKHVVLAPTGIAAINAGGATLHSFFKLPFFPLLPDDPRFSVRRIKEFLKYNSQQRKIIEELELIVIDEVSMVRADIIDFIDKVLRIYSRNMKQPFGGKQLLLVGDVFQLEPVVKTDEREILSRYYPSPYFFSAHVFGEIELVSIELYPAYTDAWVRKGVTLSEAGQLNEAETCLNEAVRLSPDLFKAVYHREKTVCSCWTTNGHWPIWTKPYL